MLRKIYFFNILIKLMLLYVFLAIISFQEIDSNWFKISFQDTIVNFGGKFGAQLSATLFLFFGKITYLIPLVLYAIFWKFFFKKKCKINFVHISCIMIHSFLFIILSCCLLSLNCNFLSHDNFLGGIIGITLNIIFRKILTNIYYVILITIFLWIYSIICFVLCFIKK